MVKSRFWVWLVLLMTLISLVTPPTSASAQVDTSAQGFLNNQNYNQLINDSDFTDINSMSANDIQNFLSSEGSDLATVDTSHLGSGANGRSAAQIIYDAAHANDPAASGCSNGICINTSTGTVSPKVIIITLQKEEGLITGSGTGWKYTGSNQGSLDEAMGYGCPDSGGCNSKYVGFTNQVGWASWQLRYNFEQSKVSSNLVSPYIAGGLLPNMSYNLPDLGLSGSLTVYMSNDATASLYRYTPHLFNGNYNFWKLGVTWFGFGTSGGGTYAGANDTSALQAGTYATTFVASGTKASADKTFFNGNQIDSGPTSWKVTISPALGTNIYTVSYVDGSGNVVGTKSIIIERRLVGDINGDGKVNVLDLSIMFSNWNQTIQGDNWADLNNVNDWMSLNPDIDNTINILDLSLMFNNWTG